MDEIGTHQPGWGLDLKGFAHKGGVPKVLVVKNRV
jgi:hypothetical protein